MKQINDDDMSEINAVISHRGYVVIGWSSIHTPGDKIQGPVYHAYGRWIPSAIQWRVIKVTDRQDFLDQWPDDPPESLGKWDHYYRCITD